MITVSMLRQELKLDANAEGDLGRKVAEVVAMWESLTNRLWAFRTGYEQLHDVDAYDTKFWVDLYPISSIAVYDVVSGTPTALIGGTWSHIAGTGRVALVSGYGQPRTFRTVVTGGYTDTTCPADVQRALITQVHYMMKRNSPEHIAVNSFGFARGNWSAMSDSPYHPMFQQMADQKARNG